MVREVNIGSITIGGQGLPVIMAGLCIIEDLEHTVNTASKLKEICAATGFPLIFKASFDKANRSSADSYRGPGFEKGLDILAQVKAATLLPLVTDIHTPDQAARVADIVDILQIPAFLCRQTDLLVAAGETGKVVNIKKGQFLAPWDMKNAVDKVQSTGNEKILLTERGSSFGYNNLVVDFRSLSYMRDIGVPVIMDATHSLQMPGGLGNATGGDREFVPNMTRAAVAWGCDGLFMELHEEPERALCDGPNTLALSDLERVLLQVKGICEVIG